MNPECVNAFREQIERRLAEPGMMDGPRYAGFLAAQERLGLVHGSRALCRHLRPYVLTYDAYRCIGRAAELVLAALERVAREALHSDELADFLGLSHAERALAAIEPGYPELVCVGRLDMLSVEEDFFFIELNADSPAGLADQLLVNRTLLELPHLQPFRARPNVTTPEPHAALLNALRQVYSAWSGGAIPGTIAIVDWAAADSHGEFKVLAEWFREHGHTMIFADPEELEYRSGRLWAKGAAVDLVYRRVIVDELIRRSGLSHPLIRAYEERAVCVANSFRTKAVNKKAAFAVLSDPRYGALFSAEQREVLAKHVPWTRRVEAGRTRWQGRDVDMLDLLARERQNLVLKPNDEYGGKGVLLGWQTPEQVWNDAAAKAVDRSFIVQERKPVKTLAMPTYRDGIVSEGVYFDVCPFLFAGRMEGAMVRLSSAALSNVSAGGGVSGLLLIDATSLEALHV
ncbi:MAG TPA: hypothetical protein VK524_33795 [Polyangiaceae bacterium]|nr:hypothetical protein [Polyangiaceae bacterium]